MATLIPGLAIKGRGTHNAKDELVAKSVEFEEMILSRPKLPTRMHEIEGKGSADEEGVGKQRRRWKGTARRSCMNSRRS